MHVARLVSLSRFLKDLANPAGFTVRGRCRFAFIHEQMRGEELVN